MKEKVRFLSLGSLKNNSHLPCTRILLHGDRGLYLVSSKMTTYFYVCTVCWNFEAEVQLWVAWVKRQMSKAHVATLPGGKGVVGLGTPGTREWCATPAHYLPLPFYACWFQDFFFTQQKTKPLRSLALCLTLNEELLLFP
jgi:hypothetical protein